MEQPNPTPEQVQQSREGAEAIELDDDRNDEPFVDILFDGPPSHESPRFIEVENSSGYSVAFGEWVQRRRDGCWVLRITAADFDTLPVGKPEEPEGDWEEKHLKGADIPGWPNPDQDIIIHPDTPARVASWYFPEESPRMDALRVELEQKIEAAVAQAKRGEPLRPSAAEIAIAYTTPERPDLREGLREDIEELAEEARQGH